MGFELFNAEPLDLKNDLDGLEDVYDIDIVNINDEAKRTANSRINNLLQLYNNEAFIEAHPEFKKRIDTEIETLRRLIKMAQTNEIIHDNLAKAISHNPNNASLYMALTRLQSNIMSIQTQIHEVMEGFNKMCKTYQTEINFEPETNSEEQEVSSNVHRGRKSFITEMMKLASEQSV